MIYYEWGRNHKQGPDWILASRADIYILSYVNMDHNKLVWSDVKDHIK